MLGPGGDPACASPSWSPARRLQGEGREASPEGLQVVLQCPTLGLLPGLGASRSPTGFNPGGTGPWVRVTRAPWRWRCRVEEEDSPRPRGSLCLHLCFLPDSDCLALGSLLSRVAFAWPSQEPVGRGGLGWLLRIVAERLPRGGEPGRDAPGVTVCPWLSHFLLWALPCERCAAALGGRHPLRLSRCGLGLRGNPGQEGLWLSWGLGRCLLPLMSPGG